VDEEGGDAERAAVRLCSGPLISGFFRFCPRRTGFRMVDAVDGVDEVDRVPSSVFQPTDGRFWPDLSVLRALVLARTREWTGVDGVDGSGRGSLSYQTTTGVSAE